MAKAKKSAKTKSPKSKPGTSSRRAKAPTKSETVEVNAGQGLLIGNMPPVKDILYHLDTIAGYQAKAKRAQGLVTDAKKKAKEAGIDLGAISLAMQFERMDPLELATHLRQLDAVMKEKGMPVQMGLFEAKFGSVEDQAKAEGWAAGKAGRSPDTARWPEGAPGHTEYMRRWNDANKDNLEGGARGGDD